MIDEKLIKKTYKEEIENIKSKFIETLNPEKIYLFGSYARGDYTKDSDYDFYIVMPSNYNVTNNVTAKAYMSLRGLKRKPVDIVVNNEVTFNERSSSLNTLENTIIKEGVVIYTK